MSENKTLEGDSLVCQLPDCVKARSERDGLVRIKQELTLKNREQNLALAKVNDELKEKGARLERNEALNDFALSGGKKEYADHFLKLKGEGKSADAISSLKKDFPNMFTDTSAKKEEKVEDKPKTDSNFSANAVAGEADGSPIATGVDKWGIQKASGGDDQADNEKI